MRGRLPRTRRLALHLPASDDEEQGQGGWALQDGPGVSERQRRLRDQVLDKAWAGVAALQHERARGDRRFTAVPRWLAIDPHRGSLRICKRRPPYAGHAGGVLVPLSRLKSVELGAVGPLFGTDRSQV
eukprot:COSAG05_NODE_5739_length_1101_cov_1.447106_2_plen_128_part_00